MSNMTKRVVILDQIGSKYIAQAIIVLKEYDPAAEEEIVREAERIVSGYMQKNPPCRQMKQRRRRKRTFSATIPAVAAAVIAAAFAAAVVVIAL